MFKTSPLLEWAIFFCNPSQTLVHMTLTGIEEYSLRLNNVITVGNIILPKAVLSRVKKFAVYVWVNRKTNESTQELGS